MLHNAGMDPHDDCVVGGMEGITTEMLRERRRMVLSWAEANTLPIAFVLAGGYISSKLSEDKLASLHRMTVEEAAASK